MKNIKNILKNIISNKNKFKASVKEATLSLLKMFLLNKLEQIKYFKPIFYVLRLFFKWSAFTSIFAAVYTIISKIFSFQYDITF